MAVKEEFLKLVPLLVGLVSVLAVVVVACGTPTPPTSEPPAPPGDPSPALVDPAGYATSAAPPRTSGLRMGAETVISGTITENYLGCTVDLPCFLRLLANGQEIVVIYHLGEYPRCLNEEAVDFGLETMVGDEVEVFGTVTGGNEISTCYSDDYYIREIP